MQEEVAGWRRHLHQTPELLYDVYETSNFVAEKLRASAATSSRPASAAPAWSGSSRARAATGPVIGLRADMDALPIHETSGKPWTSQTPGKMHACGHDGHSAMLLGAAKYLAETRNFGGAVASSSSPPKKAARAATRW